MIQELNEVEFYIVNDVYDKVRTICHSRVCSECPLHFKSKKFCLLGGIGQVLEDYNDRILEND